jgi:hypothetical protein
MNTLIDLLRDLMAKEPYNNLSTLLRETDDFEEIPLVGRLKKLEPVNKEMGVHDVSMVLLCLAFCILKIANTYARVQLDPGKLEHYLICLTYTDFRGPETNESLVPNLLYTVKPGVKRNLLDIAVNPIEERSAQVMSVSCLIDACDLSSAFQVYESRFLDKSSNEEFVRVYLLPKQYCT